MLNKHLPFYAVNIIIHTVVYFFFIIVPFNNHLRYKLKTVIIGACAYATIIIATSLLVFEYDAPFRQYSYILTATIGLAVLGIVCAILMVRGNPFQLTFIVLVIFNIQNSVIAIAKIINNLLDLPPLFGYDHLFYLIFSVVILLLYVPILWYMNIVLFKQVIDSEIQFSCWRLLALIPLCFFAFYHLGNFSGLSWYGTVTIKHLIIQIVFSATNILTYIVSLQMLLGTYKSMKETEHVHILEQQFELQKAVYKELTENMEKTARLQHDFRHHLLIMSGYIKENNTEELSAYMGKYLKNMPETEAPLCENHTVDIILRYFLGIVKKHTISYTVSVNIPNNVAIGDMDLCVIFANLVENAVSACIKHISVKNEQGFIHIRAGIKGNQLLLLIENSFNGKTEKKHELPHPYTFKQSGFGLASVKKIAEKSGGNLKIVTEKNIFKVYVLINL